MTIFWLVAICLVIAALLFVVPALLKETVDSGIDHQELNIAIYKSQLEDLERERASGGIGDEQYQRNKHELERRLLQDEQLVRKPLRSGGSRASAVAMMVVIPVATILLYNHLGSPNAITGEGPVVSKAGAKAGSGEHEESGQQIETMVQQLVDRLAANPDDYEGWLMLARSYQFMQRNEDASKALKSMRARLLNYLSEQPEDLRANLLLATAYRMDKKHKDAARAYGKVMPFIEANPDMVGDGFADLMTDYADTLALATNGSLDGEPMRLVQRALEVQPNHIRALWLSGTHAYEKAEYAQALQFWRRIAAVVAPDSEEAQIMVGNIQEAELKLRERGIAIPASPASSPEAAPQAATAPVVEGASVGGVVRLSDAFASQISPDDTVFVFARAVNGPRMPLAIIKKQASELPISFTLDSSMSMAPGMSLATVSQVVVGARVSKSGNAIAQSGDLQGFSGEVSVGAENLEIVIDQAVP